jgi:hypothetical protein
VTSDPNKPTDDLPEKIRNWLRDQGYSLEMRTARAFREAGFDVSQIEHYIDHDTGKVRQIDVIASLSKTIDDTAVQVKLIIECKYIVDTSPWIVLITPDAVDKYFYFSRFLKGQHPANWKKIDTFQGRFIGKVIESLEQKGMLSAFKVEKAGYTVKQTFLDTDSKKDQRDHAYEATLQVNKCVEAYDDDNENDHQKLLDMLDQLSDPYAASSSSSRNLQSSFYLTVAFPVIVIDGRLFEGYLSRGAVPEIKEVGNSIVFVPYKQQGKQSAARIAFSPVTIVTENHLSEYVQEIRSNIEKLLSQTDAIRSVIMNESPSNEIDINSYNEKKEEL